MIQNVNRIFDLRIEIVLTKVFREKKTRTAGVQSMRSRPGLLRIQFAYCRPIISIFSANTRSILHTVHPNNTSKHSIHPVKAKKYQKPRFRQTRHGQNDGRTEGHTLL